MADSCSETELESASESVSEHDFEMIQSDSSTARLPATDRKRSANTDVDPENIGRSIAAMKKMTKKKTDLWCLALQLTLKKLPPNARNEMKMAITSLVDQRYSPGPLADVKVKTEPLTPETENGDSAEAEIAQSKDTIEEKKAMVTKPIREKRAVQMAPGNMAAMVWSGVISMVDVATFKISVSSIYGDPSCLVFPYALDVVGRIVPETVYDYAAKVSLTNEIVLLRFAPVSDDDENAYKEFVKYLEARHRFGVIHTRCRLIKDFYVLSLPAGRSLSSTLMPSDVSVDLGAVRTDLLLGMVVKSKIKSTKAAKLGR